jgi:hypothetical protein
LSNPLLLNESSTNIPIYFPKQGEYFSGEVKKKSQVYKGFFLGNDLDRKIIFLSNTPYIFLCYNHKTPLINNLFVVIKQIFQYKNLVFSGFIT